LFVGFVGFSILCTIYYAVTAVNNINPQMSAAQWEPLRLTALTENDILLANYAAIQVRVWRIMIIEIATRVTAALVLFLCVVYVILLGWPGPSSPALGYVGLFFAVMVIAAILVIEPLWRMRVVTLIGMTMATWSNNYVVAVMGTFAS